METWEGAFVNGLASKYRDVKFITVNADRMPVCFSLFLFLFLLTSLGTNIFK